MKLINTRQCITALKALSLISEVPDSLKVFTEGIIMKERRCDLNDLRKKCETIEHPIITAIRPRSFLSIIQIGLAV